MNLTCIDCAADFEADTMRGYCSECIARFAKQREYVHARQRPARNVFADGKFATECPQTVMDPVAGKQVCGLCGSDELQQGYGLGSGYGMGGYTFCEGCDSFLDFSEDTE